MNWFRRLIGSLDDRKPSRVSEPVMREAEFKPAKLPPRKPEALQKAEEPSELNWFELQVSPHGWQERLGFRHFNHRKRMGIHTGHQLEMALKPGLAPVKEHHISTNLWIVECA